jgi:serine/threonine protein kinase
MTPQLLAGRYEIIRPLGRGAFAETVLARDTGLDRQVAVKVLHPRSAQTWKSYELWEREAKVLAELRHPAVPAVHEAFRAPFNGDDAACLVLEYVPGESLRTLIESRRHFEPDDVLHLFVEALGVLEYLHTRLPPVLHRDIKPANIIVRPDGTLALVDFGSVRNVFMTADEAGSTVAGTYGYMPYEQVMGHASPSSDLYALGATFLHLITGRAPPEFMTPEGRIAVPPSLPCGDALRGVLARMLEPAPGARFATAREARAALLSPSTAVVPAGSRRLPAAAPGVPAALLAPGPRTLDAESRALMRAAAWGFGTFLDPNEKSTHGVALSDLLFFGFFSFITAGILPAVVWSQYSARKRRLALFFESGVPATARVLGMDEVGLGFERKIMRVQYEFEADGQRRVDFDQVPGTVAKRWDAGTTVTILYRADLGYDSVIITTA